MKTLSLKLSDTLDAKLRAEARRRQTNKSAIVRDALEAFLAADGKAAVGSFLELAGDLVGSLAGPGDLSYHPRHLKGFGRS